jgi:hypothetical protein
MAPQVNFETGLLARIEELERENEMLEDGAVGTRETKLRPDGRRVSIDTTAQTIERNNRWIEDLRSLAASQPRQEDRQKLRRPLSANEQRREMAGSANR